MILEFSIENYKSFRERQTFSLGPDEGKSEAANHLVSVGDNKYTKLRSAVIYRANASGKNNFIKALEALRSLLLLPADRVPYRLLTTPSKSDTSFIRLIPSEA